MEARKSGWVMSDKRKIEIKKDGVWEEFKFADLKKGMIFRMFESTGEPVVDKKEEGEIREWECTESARIRPDGVGEICANPVIELQLKPKDEINET